MATVTHHFLPQDAVQPTSSFATFDTISGTYFPFVVLDFASSGTESAYFFLLSADYGSGNPTVTIYWAADTATSGSVVWSVQLAAVTPNTEATSLASKLFDGAQTVTDTHLGTIARRVHSCDVTISNLDGLTAGEYVVLKVSRLGSDVSDTMAGDAMLLGLKLTYSDT